MSPAGTAALVPKSSLTGMNGAQPATNAASNRAIGKRSIVAALVPQVRLEQLASEYPKAVVTPSNAKSSDQFNAWMTALNARLTGKKSRKELPLDIQGTAFQKRVWEFLRTIPSGDVVSYGEVAAAIGAPRAVRAAASACANNRIGVLIPCHRVIRGTGELGGYRWGLSRKRTLIDTERRARSDRQAK